MCLHSTCCNGLCSLHPASYLSFSFLNTFHSGFCLHSSQKLQLPMSIRTFILPNPKDNFQSSVFVLNYFSSTNRTDHSFLFFLKHFPHLTSHSPGFLCLTVCFFPFPSRALNVGVLQGSVLSLLSIYIYSLTRQHVVSWT